MKWTELMEANRDAIVEKMVEAFKEAEGGMSGWGIGVEMDQAGDVWTTGLMSQGNQSESSWKGETTVVENVMSWNLDYDETEYLTWPEYEYLEAEFEQYKVDEDDEYAIFREWMKENHADTLATWDKTQSDFEVDSFYDAASDKFDDLLRNQVEYETYNDEDAQF